MPKMAQKSNFEKHCYASYSFDFRDTSRNFLQVKTGPKIKIPALGREWGLETVLQALCDGFVQISAWVRIASDLLLHGKNAFLLWQY